MKKILGFSTCGGLKTKGYDLEVLFNNRKHFAKYEIFVNGNILARTDTEEKARMCADAFNEGYSVGINSVKEGGQK